ncbi:3239_t:CDS:2 [Funneliformis caledonium]|uniref:3239_t:CDS:1 n=1 Tax=Funneliformis caledonium TaxID=1117310 RepID=A0A9N9DKK9_9GLOM|nr:3239_t:CDS:2 [Funneliformis caledonium]
MSTSNNLSVDNVEEILCAEPYRFLDGPARRIITLIDSLNIKGSSTI